MLTGANLPLSSNRQGYADLEASHGYGEYLRGSNNKDLLDSQALRAKTPGVENLQQANNHLGNKTAMPADHN